MVHGIKRNFDLKLYGLMAVISILIRNFVLPNPFDCFGDSAFIINLIAEPIIHAVAFGLVGLVYNRGEAPALGSILYLLAYAMITGVLFLLGIFSFAWWWILIIVVAVIGVVCLFRFLTEKMTDRFV